MLIVVHRTLSIPFGCSLFEAREKPLYLMFTCISTSQIPNG